MAAQGAPQQQPRALVLSSLDRDVVIRRLARAVLKFQDEFLERDSSPAGLLCQCWLPKVTDEKEVVLVTKGMPFCVAGLGDLLALFRCISCRFSFGTNVKKTAQLGAPGRVFTSSEPELACNVQHYSKTAYLRKAEAEQCQVQSTLLLPLFLSNERRGCVGVLEVVQTSEDMHFTEMADLIASVLEKCQLYTAQRPSIERQLQRATATATLLLPPSVDILGTQERAQSDDSNGRAHSTEDAVPMADEDVLQLAMRPGSVGGTSGSGGAVGGAGGPLSGEGGGAGGSGPQTTTAAAGGDGEQRRQTSTRAAGRRAAAAAVEAALSEEDEDLGEDSGDDMDEDGGPGGAGRGDAKSMGTAGTGRRRGKGTGNPGKPGVRLRLEDLQSQFGVGLKEAAARLGICPTTLKRACRRHGIQRWPRRQLMKVNQALDQMEAQGGPLALLQHQHQHQAVAAVAAQAQQQQAAAAAQLGALSGLPAPDTRWTTLAQFIPAFQSSMQYNDHLLPYSGSQPMLTGAGSMAALSGIGGGGGGGGAGGPLGGLGLGGWGNGGGMNGGGLNGHASAAAGGQLGGLGLGLGLGGGAGGLGGGGSGFPGNLLAELQAGSAAAAAGGVGPGGGSGPGGGKSAFQPPGNRGPAASPSKAESGTSSLPAGVLPLGGGAGGGGGGNGVPHPIFGFPAEAPALSGISSLGQPPPPADLGSGSSAQRLAALKAGLARAGNNAAGAGMGVGAPSLQGKPSWQLPSLQLPLSGGTPLSSLDYELGRLAAPGGPGLGGGPVGQQPMDPEQQLRVNDDDVGFLDSSVLEMLLQEDASRAAGNAPSGLTADDAARGAAVSSALSSLKFR